MPIKCLTNHLFVTFVLFEMLLNNICDSWIKCIFYSIKRFGNKVVFLFMWLQLTKHYFKILEASKGKRGYLLVNMIPMIPLNILFYIC